jgi:hypothetical protein
MLRKWNLKLFQKLLGYAPGGTGSIGSYAGRVNISYGGTERIPRSDVVDVYIYINIIVTLRATYFQIFIYGH